MVDEVEDLYYGSANPRKLFSGPRLPACQQRFPSRARCWFWPCHGFWVGIGPAQFSSWHVVVAFRSKKGEFSRCRCERKYALVSKKGWCSRFFFFFFFFLLFFFFLFAFCLLFVNF